MSRDQWGDVVFKGILGAGFFFVLQYVVMKASLDTSLFWAAALGIGAGLLAWSQHRRGV
jgi:hypothetical protein